MTNQDKLWHPTLSIKGQEVFNWSAKARLEHPNAPVAGLLAGARYSTKTFTTMHTLMRHLWETPGASLCIFSNALKVLTDAGPWQQLFELIQPEWESGVGLKVLTKNRAGEFGGIVDSKTRTVYAKVSNYFGGESRLQLNSIQHDGEIEEKLKSTSFSAIWFSELNQFADPRVFTNSILALRMKHLAPWQHLWLGDTNPAKEGVDSWIYKKWFLKHKPITEGEQAIKGNDELARSLRLQEFFLEDNPFITEERRDIIRATYQDDPLEYEREINGKWVKGMARNKIFANLFSHEKHVVGEIDEALPSRGEIKLAPDTDKLESGWDIGSGRNHAAGIIEKRTITRPDPVGTVSIFNIICSLKQVGEHVSAQDFTRDYMSMKQVLEKKYPGRKFFYTNYSDDSAINQPRNSGAGYDYLEVKIASKGEIILTGVAKPKNSVAARKRLIKRLLAENRLFCSANCTDVIAMFEEATSSKSEEVEWNEHKHTFDWISYVLYMLCFDEMEEIAAGPMAAVTSISVPLA